jgi:hypothetical protein
MRTINNPPDWGEEKGLRNVSIRCASLHHIIEQLLGVTLPRRTRGSEGTLDQQVVIPACHGIQGHLLSSLTCAPWMDESGGSSQRRPMLAWLMNPLLSTTLPWEEQRSALVGPVDVVYNVRAQQRLHDVHPSSSVGLCLSSSSVNNFSRSPSLAEPPLYAFDTPKVFSSYPK